MAQENIIYILKVDAQIEGIKNAQDRITAYKREILLAENELRKFRAIARESGQGATEMAGKIAVAETRLKGLRYGLVETQREMLGLKGFTQKLGQAMAMSMGRMGALFLGPVAAAGAAAYAMGQGIRHSVNALAEFDKAVANVRALGDDYAKNIGRLAEAAKHAGTQFGFSAKESMEAVENLAKAGVTSADIMGGALTGALTLAAAGQLSVAEASEVAAKTMTQFNLAGRDVPHIADLLAAGAAKATGDVHDMSKALAQAGLVANQFKVPIEDAIGALTAFAAQGLINSDAGTSFKTMLQRLANPAKESVELMKRFNLEAYDAQGNFIGLTALAQKYQDGLKDLTDEQRTNALASIFGSDAIRSITVLYKLGEKGLQQYIDMVNEAGFAKEVATEKVQNLDDKLHKLGLRYDELIVTMGETSTINKGLDSIDNAFRVIIALARDGSVLGSDFTDGMKRILSVVDQRQLSIVEAYTYALQEIIELNSKAKFDPKAAESAFSLITTKSKEAYEAMRQKTQEELRNIKTLEDLKAANDRYRSELDKATEGTIEWADAQFRLNKLLERANEIQNTSDFSVEGIIGRIQEWKDSNAFVDAVQSLIADELLRSGDKFWQQRSRDLTVARRDGGLTTEQFDAKRQEILSDVADLKQIGTISKLNELTEKYNKVLKEKGLLSAEGATAQLALNLLKESAIALTGELTTVEEEQAKSLMSQINDAKAALSSWEGRLPFVEDEQQKEFYRNMIASQEAVIQNLIAQETIGGRLMRLEGDLKVAEQERTQIKANGVREGAKELVDKDAYIKKLKEEIKLLRGEQDKAKKEKKEKKSDEERLRERLSLIQYYYDKEVSIIGRMEDEKFLTKQEADVKRLEAERKNIDDLIKEHERLFGEDGIADGVEIDTLTDWYKEKERLDRAIERGKEELKHIEAVKVRLIDLTTDIAMIDAEYDTTLAALDRFHEEQRRMDQEQGLSRSRMVENEHARMADRKRLLLEWEKAKTEAMIAEHMADIQHLENLKAKGRQLTAEQEIQLQDAKDFVESYKGVVNEINDAIDRIGDGRRRTKNGDLQETLMAQILGLSDDHAQWYVERAAELANIVTNAIWTIQTQKIRSALDERLDVIDSYYDKELKLLEQSREAQSITEEEYENRKMELDKRIEMQREAERKKAFEKEKKIKKEQLGLEFAIEVARIASSNAVLGPAAPPAIALQYGIAFARYMAGLAMVDKASYYERGGRVGDGGLAVGPSHAQGGIKGRVKGKKPIEFEGGEFIVNKRSTQRHLALLKQLNSDGMVPRFARGGEVSLLPHEDLITTMDEAKKTRRVKSMPSERNERAGVLYVSDYENKKSRRDRARKRMKIG